MTTNADRASYGEAAIKAAIKAAYGEDREIDEDTWGETLLWMLHYAEQNLGGYDRYSVQSDISTVLACLDDDLDNQCDGCGAEKRDDAGEGEDGKCGECADQLVNSHAK